MSSEDTTVQLTEAWPFKQFLNELVLFVSNGHPVKETTHSVRDGESLNDCFKKHGAWSCSGLPMQSGYPYSRCGLDRIKGNCITVLWCGCSMICLVFRPEAAVHVPGPTAILC